jgi:hypothetical protein
LDKPRVCAALLAMLLWTSAAPGRAQQLDSDLAHLGVEGALPPNVVILFDTSQSMRQITWDAGFDPNRFYDRVTSGGLLGLGESGGECNIPDVAAETSSGPPIHYDPYTPTNSSTLGYVEVSGSATFNVTCPSGLLSVWKPAHCTAWNSVFGANMCTTVSGGFQFRAPDVDPSGEATLWNLNYLHYLFHTLHTTGSLPPGFVKETRIMTGRRAVIAAINSPEINPDDTGPSDLVEPNCTSGTPYQERVRFGLARYRKSGSANHGWGSYVSFPIADCR